MAAVKVALVTGSGRDRVGRHVARALAKRGYAIVIHYRNSAAEAAEAMAQMRELGVEAIALRADVSDEASVRRLIDDTLERFGRLDVLVTCAAIWSPKRLEDVTATDVRANFETNALGTFLCAQQAGLAMVRQPEGGAIVTMGDWAVARPYPNYAAYFPSKGAVVAMTRSLAVELAARNPRVRVNCVAPGPVMLRADLSQAERDQAIAGTLVKHDGTPHDVAQAVLSLIENDFITGVCLPVDGGRSIYAEE